ncbi:MAG: phosphatidate cytidylyltransferase [Gammaproteobacteria bacterium]
MLKQRIITALVMLAVLLPALFHSRIEYFALLTLLLIAAAGWEWCRLNGVAGRASIVAGVFLGGLMAVLWWHSFLDEARLAIWVIASVAWAGIATTLLSRGVPQWGAWPSGLRLVGGGLLLAVAWLALVEARRIGLVYLLSVLTLVWMADIAAYFGGKTWGRRKLAPTISPAKSWEGACSGFAGVCLLAAFWIWYDSLRKDDSLSIFGLMLQHGWIWLVAAVLSLTAMSVVGDLIESLVKRSAGVKDSSGLLPGHGGVLDRVDALLPVLPVALMFTQLP